MVSNSKSRLEEKLVRRSERNIFLIAAGLIILLVLFFVFGLQMLINFSLLVEKSKPASDTTSNAADKVVLPPILNPVEDATNSAQITISGYSLPEQNIKLFINGKFIQQTFVHSDKSFSFNYIQLDPGENDIKAKAITTDNKESDYSQDMQIKYINTSPSLSLDSPQDGQSITKGSSPIKVSGQTDPGDKITINDFWAIVDDQGKYSYILPLHNGDNKITIKATDAAGNITTKDVTIKYSQ